MAPERGDMTTPIDDDAYRELSFFSFNISLLATARHFG